MGALGNQAEQTWTSHQITLLDKIPMHWKTREVHNVSWNLDWRSAGQLRSCPRADPNESRAETSTTPNSSSAAEKRTS